MARTPWRRRRWVSFVIVYMEALNINGPLRALPSLQRRAPSELVLPPVATALNLSASDLVGRAEAVDVSRVRLWVRLKPAFLRPGILIAAEGRAFPYSSGDADGREHSTSCSSSSSFSVILLIMPGCWRDWFPLLASILAVCLCYVCCRAVTVFASKFAF